MKLTSNIPEQSYVCHEAWFEIRDIHKKTGEKGKLIVNSYGRVREVFEDGTFHDIHDGKQI